MNELKKHLEFIAVLQQEIQITFICLPLGFILRKQAQ